jgi:hypothetical protein
MQLNLTNPKVNKYTGGVFGTLVSLYMYMYVCICKLLSYLDFSYLSP